MTEDVSSSWAGNILAEDFNLSQDSSTPAHPRSVPRELNFDFGQLFYPNEKRKIFEVRYFRRTSQSQEVSAVINPHAQLGTLTTFDERVFYALLELWQEQDKAAICRFSEREVARRIKRSWGGDTPGAIRDSLTRLASISIEWKGSFYDSATGELVDVHNPFCILSHLEITSTKTRHFRDQRAEFSLNQRIIKNLNSNFYRPIRFDVILSFSSPLVQALYTLLDRQLYGTNQYHRTSAGLLLEDLGLIGAAYQHRKSRVQCLKRVQSELRGTPTGYGEVIEKFEITSRKKDALVLIGRSGAPRIKGKQVEVIHHQAGVLESPGAAPQHKRSRKREEQPHEEVKREQVDKSPSVKGSSPSRGKTGLQSVSEIFDTQKPPDKVVSIATEETRLIELFVELFKSKRRSKNDVVNARKIIQQHGIEAAEHLVRYAYKEAPKTDYHPWCFSGIMKYLNDSLEDFRKRKENATLTSNRRTKVTKNDLDQARYSYQLRYTKAWLDFLDEVISSLEEQERYLAKLSEYRKWEYRQLDALLEQQNPDGDKAVQERITNEFNQRERQLKRIYRFFMADQEIMIPGFWEWDAKHNESPYPYAPSDDEQQEAEILKRFQEKRRLG